MDMVCLHHPASPGEQEAAKHDVRKERHTTRHHGVGQHEEEKRAECICGVVKQLSRGHGTPKERA